MSTRSDPAEGLDAHSAALLDTGSRLMWRVERETLRKALARHLHDGTTKYARSVRTEGIDCVTLSLSAGLWIVRAFWIFFIGLVLFTLGRRSAVIHTAGSVLLLVFAVLMALGLGRLVQAWMHRRAFRRNHD